MSNYKLDVVAKDFDNNVETAIIEYKVGTVTKKLTIDGTKLSAKGRNHMIDMLSGKEGVDNDPTDILGPVTSQKDLKAFLKAYDEDHISPAQYTALIRILWAAVLNVPLEQESS